MVSLGGTARPDKAGMWGVCLVTLASVLQATPERATCAERTRGPLTGKRLSDPVVLAQLPLGTDAEKAGPESGGMLPARYGDRGRLILIDPRGRLRRLVPDFHSACDPSVSFDGRRIVFAGKRTAHDHWNIYEIGADGSGLRQITRGLGDCRSPCYLSPVYRLPPVGAPPSPWHQVLFVAGAGTAEEYGPSEATHLYVSKLDGSAVRRLTYNISSDKDPWLMGDGLVVFASWQRARLDHGALGRVALLAMNLDGTDCALYAEYGRGRIQHMPCATSGGLVIFVEADRVPWDGAGRLAAVSIRRPLHSYRPLTEEAEGLFHSPSPLPDGTVLVSRRPADGSGSHAIYRLDPQGGRAELVFDDPRYHDIHAHLVVPRDRPDGRSSVVSEKDPHGKMYCLNVYIHDLPEREWWAPGMAQRLRVLEGIPAPVGRQTKWQGGQAGVFGIPRLAQRRFLGEIPIEADGSFNIEIPANVPIELQVLDENGLAVRRCGWIWSRNHEPRGCIGCHEDGELTPENWLVDALKKPSIPLTLPPERRRTVDFRRDVMPIIQSRCIGCHGPEGAPPRLDVASGPSGGRSPAPFNQPYRALLARQAGGGGGLAAYRYVHPGRARTSPLVWHLLGRNTARPWDGPWVGRPAKPIPEEGPKPTEDEVRMFIEWIDLGALWDGIPDENDR